MRRPGDHGLQDQILRCRGNSRRTTVTSLTVSQVGQNFTFVLTDIDSKQRFGFCRLSSGAKSCFCILSGVLFEGWEAGQLERGVSSAPAASLRAVSCRRKLLFSSWSFSKKTSLVQPSRKQPEPRIVAISPGSKYFISYLTSWQITRQKDRRVSGMSFLKLCINFLSLTQECLFISACILILLCLIPENFPAYLRINLTEYFVAVDVNNMLHLYASMLYERRILIICSKLSTLTACIHGSAAMLYPMFWQHVYIPVLPPHLLDYCCAPMPYLIGIHLSLMEVSWLLSSPDLSTCGFVLLHSGGKETVSGFPALHMGACRRNTSRVVPSQVHRAEHST
nr:DENN domain-containing protein 2D-like isoform X4 [Equus caballus]